MGTTKWRLLWAAGAWAATSMVYAQGVVLQENFDAAGTGATIGAIPPDGWSVQTFYSDGTLGGIKVTEGSAQWLGWKFLTPGTWKSHKTADWSTKRGDFARGAGGIAVLESDGLRGERAYSASLISPAVAVQAAQSYEVRFDTHYRQGKSPQNADVTIIFDKGAPVVRAVSGDALNQQIKVSFAVPDGATTAQVTWNYRNTSNNWYWAVDNVRVERAASAPVAADPVKLPETSNRPNLSVGPVLQNPGPDHMSVMIETSEPQPAVWVRKLGSGGPFTVVRAANATGDFADASIFFADLSGLDSNTLYEYAVVTGTSAAPKVAGPFRFKTWPKESDKVASAKFGVISDTQDGLFNRFGTLMQGLIANDCAGDATRCAETLAGFLVPGDLVTAGSNRALWRGQFFKPFGAISAYVPLLPAPGNHDYFNEQADAGTDKKWLLTYRKYFNRLPANGSTLHPLHWYHTDYLGLRIVASDFNPASAMHNAGLWPLVDHGRGLYRADYAKEHLDWFTQLMKQTRTENKPYVVLLNHQPCLSEKWRQGEVMAACDFIAQLEDYGRSSGAITANLNGHVHFYERGDSMDSRHLWLNVATGSGALEGAAQEDDSDLDVMAHTRLSFGYGTLEVSFGGQVPSLEWKRYDLNSLGLSVSNTPDDSLRITSERFGASPKLAEAKLGKVDPTKVKLDYVLEGAQKPVYEAQWQLSRASTFDHAQRPVYDVWGNDTRRENWTFLNGQRVNTQSGVNLSSLELGRILANPRRVYHNADANSKRGKVKRAIVAGGNSLLDRWSCAYKWDDFGDVGAERQGGRHCFARLVQPDGEKGSAFDPFREKAPEVLSFGTDERWYWRVRVRDENLNWSDWSEAGSFEIGNPAPEALAPTPALPVVERQLIDTLVTVPGTALAPVNLQVRSLAQCQQVASNGGPVPDGVLPGNYRAVSGLISFGLLQCDQPGFEAKVQLTLPAVLPADSKLLKVTRDGNGRFHASEIANAVMAGNIVSYSVIDGGALDEDGQLNGTIIDPVVVVQPAPVILPPPVAPPPLVVVPAPVPVTPPVPVVVTPTTPVTPANPVAPTAPAVPTTPETPATPAVPVTPVTPPVAPVTPETPAPVPAPATPVAPATPTPAPEPATPTTPTAITPPAVTTVPAQVPVPAPAPAQKLQSVPVGHPLALSLLGLVMAGWGAHVTRRRRAGKQG